ncbi:MAG: nitrilase-related carbon-nitrogen hydrolase, partial [Candidatus Hodarchaeales archaeon]
MSRSIKCGLIQAKNEKDPTESSPEEIKEANIAKHEKLIQEAGEKGVQILCLQELFIGPYFPAEQDIKWYELTEKVPGPTVDRLAKYAKDYHMVLILPVYEEEITGVYY